MNLAQYSLTQLWRARKLLLAHLGWEKISSDILAVGKLAGKEAHTYAIQKLNEEISRKERN